MIDDNDLVLELDREIKLLSLKCMHECSPREREMLEVLKDARIIALQLGNVNELSIEELCEKIDKIREKKEKPVFYPMTPSERKLTVSDLTSINDLEKALNLSVDLILIQNRDRW